MSETDRCTLRVSMRIVNYFPFHCRPETFQIFRGVSRNNFEYPRIKRSIARLLCKLESLESAFFFFNKKESVLGNAFSSGESYRSQKSRKVGEKFIIIYAKKKKIKFFNFQLCSHYGSHLPSFLFSEV